MTNRAFGNTIESDSFGINLTGTFRTAAFGGNALDNQQPAPAITNIPSGPSGVG